jgi:hypothetical protein
MPDTEEPPKPKTQGGIFACIYRHGGNTFCGRMPASNEYMFSREGADHEIAHYDPRNMPKTPSPRLAACIECIDAAKAVIAKEGMPRIA